MFRRRHSDDDPSNAPEPPADADALEVPSPEVTLDLRDSRRRLRRTWPQRLVLSLNIVLVLACFGAAVALYGASSRLSQRQVVTIQRSTPAQLATAPGSFPADEGMAPVDEVDFLDFPDVDVAAQNWLVTGVDNGDCVVPGQAPADNIGDRSQLGERSDTIMLIRIDPAANQAAILSFPRDLWVNIAGSNRKSRINAAFDGSDPSRLVQTIEQNFFIPVDHLLGVDFCAFKEIVSAVGGVKVPFAYAVRDRKTGLAIPAPGCYSLDADEALNYVRSRAYEYQDPDTGDWRQDPTSDFGRISRQQDFTRRVLQKALDRGARDPRVAWELLNTGIEYVVTDDDTTPQSLLQLAQAMRNLDPASIRTYTIESRPIRVGNNAVLEPRLATDNMEQILMVFRGLARIAEAPEQLFAPPEVTTTLTPATTFPPPTTTTTTTTLPPFGQTDDQVDDSSTSSVSTRPPVTTTTSTTSSLPLVLPEENVQGIVPPDDPDCR